MRTCNSKLPWFRRWTWKQSILRGAGLGLVTLAIAAGLLHWRLRSSLPMLDGILVTDSVASDVTMERDAQGVPTINAESRTDTAFAIGFLHAQDRFFQMDMLRRMSSGQISELVGAVALPLDEKFRKHRFQASALKIVEALPAEHKAILDSYSRGVNYGLSKLGAPTFEYTLLRHTPKPWRPVDSIHVLLTMLADLQQIDGDDELGIGQLRESVPKEVFEFLVRQGSNWDAAMDNSMMEQPQVPSAELWSLRNATDEQTKESVDNKVNPSAAYQVSIDDSEQRVGSNNWAIGSDLGKDKRAILASDMHLGLRVPTIWYRAVMNTPCLDGVKRRLVGVTLPGTPTLVEGSNGSVAWGLTNSYGDFGDIVELVPVGDDVGKYMTPDGPKSIERFQEEIAYPGGAKKIEYEWTIWGPIVAKRGNRCFVYHWVGDDHLAMDMKILDLELAQSMESAIRCFSQAGMPHLNAVVADREGNIGWTLCGRIPRRSGPPTRSPVDWSKGGGWSGYLSPDEYPKLVNPADGRIWTANSRVVGGDMLAIIGNGGYDLGARARQIRDRLRNKSEFDERDMLAIQLDDEALFLKPWHELLTKTLQKKENYVSPEFVNFMEQWGGHANPDSVGYRIVRTFRNQVLNHLFEAAINEKTPTQNLGAIPKRAGIKRRVPMAQEDVIWQLLTERPQHWLPSEFESWDVLHFGCSQSNGDGDDEKPTMSKATWGDANKTGIFHPLSMGLPIITGWLGMPMCHYRATTICLAIQRSGFGASQRLVVSPGFEENGIYHQPGGQSGHPYSPFYKSGFDDWANGVASPLLPGATHTR